MNGEFESPMIGAEKAKGEVPPPAQSTLPLAPDTCFVYTCSPDFRIESANDYLRDHIGHDLVGRACYQALYGRETVCPWCFRDRIQHGDTIRYELKNPLDHRWYCHVRTAIRHPDDSVSHMTVMMDITEKKRRERSFEKDRRKLTTLMSNLPGMAFCCLLDEPWTVTFASKGCEKLLGYHPSELVGNSVQIVHRDDVKQVREQIKIALEKRKSYQITYRIKTASGEDKWVIEQGEGVYSDKGAALALDGYMTDISEHKKVELELQKENCLLKNAIREVHRLGDIIGKSPAMQRVYGLILNAASTDVNIIIYGKSGTGKELAARAIHDLSNRSHKAFVPVNCGAISENLFESEFFGYKKGAFTGATADREGYLDAADGGTLFLDEVGEISLGMQVKLLRVLDGYGHLPVGGTQTRTSNFRVIAATNRNLREMVKSGRLREDFYYRIHIIPIPMPALKDHREDIPLLIDHFLSESQRTDNARVVPEKMEEILKRYEMLSKTKQAGNKKLSPILSKVRDSIMHTALPSATGCLEKKSPPLLSEQEKTALVNHDWPGNVRELKNVIQQYSALGSFSFLKKEIPMPGREPDTVTPELFQDADGLKSVLDRMERQFILKVLETNRWRRDKTATQLKITTRTLQRKMNTYNIH
jgi:PAS domain S-box-containing protein